MKHQQQGIRGNVTSNNKQTPPRLNTDGLLFNFITTIFSILHIIKKIVRKSDVFECFLKNYFFNNAKKLLQYFILITFTTVYYF